MDAITALSLPVCVIITVVLLITSSHHRVFAQCPGSQKKCGDICIGSRDFCTLHPTGAKCGLARACDDDTCVSKSVACNPRTCPNGYKRCFDTGRCIARGKRCCTILVYDECADGACLSILGDRYCECRVLSNFHCDNKQCIPRHKYCDSRWDCDDGSDELGCVTVPPGIDNSSAEDSTGSAINSTVLIFSAVAGVVIIVLLILCMIVCSRRKPNGTNGRYWQRRERSFTEQTPTARTAHTLVRGLSVPLATTQQSTVSEMTEPMDEYGEGEGSLVRLDDSAAPAAAPPTGASPLRQVEENIDLPPSYEEVIKSSSAAIPPSSDDLPTSHDAANNNSTGNE